MQNSDAPDPCRCILSHVRAGESIAGARCEKHRDDAWGASCQNSAHGMNDGQDHKTRHRFPADASSRTSVQAKASRARGPGRVATVSGDASRHRHKKITMGKTHWVIPLCSDRLRQVVVRDASRRCPGDAS